MVNDLPDREREITMLRFGFYNDETHIQKEIAEMLSISPSHVSRVITKVVKQIGEQLEEKGLIVLKTKNKIESLPKTKDKIESLPKSKIKAEEAGAKMSKLQTIYQYFKDYTKEQIDAMIEELSEEDKALITLRYGENLNNPVSKKITKAEKSKFYGNLIPKMKRLLSNPNKGRKPLQQQNQLKTEVASETPISRDEESKAEIPESSVVNTGTTKEDEYIPISLENPISSELPNDNRDMNKDDCIKLLELLRTPSFNQMMSVLSVKESVIISLKLGYVDGKYFSTDSIAQFLGIEQQEVIDTTTKALLLYKENINQFIDNAIEIATESPKQFMKKQQ